MKYLILFLFSPILLLGQSLSVFDIDTTNYPTIKAKFYAFDAGGNQILNLNPSDFEVTEDGEKREVTYVSCPSPKPPLALSSVLVMDASGSMGTNNLNLAKSAAQAWIEGLPLGQSECAITAFDTKNYMILDFSTDKNKLLSASMALFAKGGTDYDAAMLDPLAGGLLITKKGKYKKVIVFLTDGRPNTEPQTNKIIAEANVQNVTIYSVTLNMECPQNMKDMSTQTGGLWFENVTTIAQAKQIYQNILQTAQGAGEPCEIEWQSDISCIAGITNYQLLITNLGLEAKGSYQSPQSSIAKLEFDTSAVKFPNPDIGVKVEEKVMVTARNADFTVTNITSNNGAFSISPTSFVLNANQSQELTISYLPADSGYNYCKFTIENDICPTMYYASGGWKGKKPTIRTLKLIHPNGAEIFIAGKDTVITWEGVSPDDPVRIEYSTNWGASWIIIAENISGLSYKWKVPKTPSKQCLARVTAKVKIKTLCNNPDVQICDQFWMGCNLDVDTYRNGDPIPEVTDSAEWVNLKTGAWCYYNNDPANGEIYGKLYNWYAVNDPRGLAPEGWHVPTDDEWKKLEMCIGMPLSEADKDGWRGTNEGGKLKAIGTLQGGDGLWNTPNTGATNESDFSALPGGWFSINLGYSFIGRNGYWWSSTESNIGLAWLRSLSYNEVNIFRYNYDKLIGFSVRCVKD